MRSSAFVLFLAALLGCGKQPSAVVAPAPRPVAEPPPTAGAEAVSSPPSPGPPAPEPAPVPEEPLAPALPDDVDVALRTELPKGYAEDGKIDEWGNVCAPLPGKQPAPKPKRAPAPTCLTLAVLADKVVMAGRLGKDGVDGLWLGLTMPLPQPFPSPRIGQGLGQEVDCEHPEPARAGLCKRHMQRVIAAAESTARYYRITPDDFRWYALRDGLPAGRGSTPPDARAVRGSSQDTFEITLPLSALPRAGSASIEKVFTVQGVGELPKTQLKWAPRALPSPVRFAPLADLRADLMSRILSSGLGIALYQPGSDELELFAAAPDGATREMVQKTRRLFAPKVKTASIEAALAPGAPHDVLVVKTKDQEPKVPALDTWRAFDLAVVDGEPRAFTIFSSCDLGGPCAATVLASRIAEDGSLEPIPLRIPDGADTTQVDAATPYAEKGGLVFGLRGSTSKGGKRTPFDLRMTWNASTKTYEGTWKGPR